MIMTSELRSGDVKEVFHMKLFFDIKWCIWKSSGAVLMVLFGVLGLLNEGSLKTSK